MGPGWEAGRDAMAAVINLNILNFFGFKQDNSTGNNVRFKTVTLDQHQEDDPDRERIIDVTPFSSVVDDDSDYGSYAATRNAADYRQRNIRRPIPAMNPTYNRQGRLRHYNYPKGTHIDLYV